MSKICSRKVSHAKTESKDSSPGEIGTIVEDDGSSKPFKVKSSDGKTWWYKKQALQSPSSREGSGCADPSEDVSPASSSTDDDADDDDDDGSSCSVPATSSDGCSVASSDNKVNRHMISSVFDASS